MTFHMPTEDVRPQSSLRKIPNASVGGNLWQTATDRWHQHLHFPAQPAADSMMAPFSSQDSWHSHTTTGAISSGRSWAKKSEQQTSDINTTLVCAGLQIQLQRLSVEAKNYEGGAMQHDSTQHNIQAIRPHRNTLPLGYSLYSTPKQWYVPNAQTSKYLLDRFIGISF